VWENNDYQFVVFLVSLTTWESMAKLQLQEQANSTQPKPPILARAFSRALHLEFPTQKCGRSGWEGVKVYENEVDCAVAWVGERVAFGDTIWTVYICSSHVEKLIGGAQDFVRKVGVCRAGLMVGTHRYSFPVAMQHQVLVDEYPLAYRYVASHQHHPRMINPQFSSCSQCS
jgi:hypothetical protein